MLCRKFRRREEEIPFLGRISEELSLHFFLHLSLCCRWFHGSITRDEAELLLQPRDDGLFLVRESTNFPGDYTLCVCYQGKVEHYRVKYLENKLTIDDEEYFENLGHLVAVSFSPLVFFTFNNLEIILDWTGNSIQLIAL